MSNPKSIAPAAKEHATAILNPVAWEQIKGMSATFITLKKQGAIPKQIESQEQLMMIMQAGYEMGMKPLESLKSFYVVNGMLNLWGAAVIKRLREHGFRIKYEHNEQNESVKATVSRPDTDEEYIDTFSFKEAQESGWTAMYNKIKPGWIKGANRNLKLRYGVISKIVKTYIPEVMGSAHDIADIAIDASNDDAPLPDPKAEEGRVVETEEKASEPLPEPSEPPKSKQSAVEKRKQLKDKQS